MPVNPIFPLKLLDHSIGNTCFYPKGSFIYKIVNLKNNKLYIGQTRNFKSRINQHVGSLNKKSHQNKYLQRSFDKHGYDNFNIEIIEEVQLDNLTEREQYWCDYYKSYNRENGYNQLKDVRSPWYGKRSEEHCRKIALANTGRKHSIESRRKMSKARMGRFVGKEHPFAKEIQQFDKNMEFISEYDSITEAATISKIGRTSINNNLCGRSMSAGGFIWKFKNE